MQSGETGNNRTTAVPQEWLEVGKIVGVRGLRGEVRVLPSTDFPERFEVPGPRWLQTERSSAPHSFELERGQLLPGKNIYIVKFAGVDDREGAEALRGARVLVPASDRPELAADEYHVADLIGLDVVLQATGESIGVVVDLYEAGNDLLEIELRAPSDSSDTAAKRSPPTVLVPFVKAIVPVVDIAAGRLELDPPTGLLAIDRR
ncbi:ribosome maturation factor RimM [Rubidibacter lacunae]|nr:ribosome maturation factor RimM [Rubidibacter lacunae]